MIPVLAAAIPFLAYVLSDLGEGPVWDERRSRLYWVDIVQGCLHWLDADASRRSTWRIGGTLSFLVLTSNPDRLVAGHNATLVALDPDSRQMVQLAALEQPGDGRRCNDAKCDPTGRLWAGTMGWGDSPQPGSLYAIDNAWQPVRKITGLAIANGLAWHQGRKEMHFVDSPADRVVAGERKS